MSDQRSLLVEIGTEELPPKALPKLSDAFTQGIVEGLIKAAVANPHPVYRSYATPRRLAVLIEAVDSRQPDRENLRRGPALAAARNDQGEPTPAAVGFARSCGVTIEELDTLMTEQGSWLCYRTIESGQHTKALLADIVNASLSRLPIPKRMRWGDNAVEFVRPVHWVVLMLGSEVVGAEILGVSAGGSTYGHRFHHPQALRVPSADDYADLLRSVGKVEPDFTARRQTIESQVKDCANRCAGRAVIDPDLLDEVTSLVEWPRAVTGKFNAEFLDLPAELLIAVMKDQQRYFHVVDADRRLLPRFITVANIDSSNPDTIVRGNERVVTPRLTDGAFFWEQDRRTPLYARRDQLKEVVFQKQLGSLFDKSERVAQLAGIIAERIGGNVDWARRAGELAKCDLLSSLVGEFPGLQGTMGRYYAEHDGELADIAAAIEEHYQPRFAGDALPETETGIALALADKLDTLVGIFGIGQVPTGDRDPFALRRAALGVLRILIEKELALDLQELIDLAALQLQGRIDASAISVSLPNFMWERLRGYLVKGDVTPDAFETVLAVKPGKPLDLERRLQAVVTFRDMPEAESLASANKRIANLLRQSQASVESESAVCTNLLQEPAEQELYNALLALQQQVQDHVSRAEYAVALQMLAGLRPAVDAFFDHVMVMTEDQSLRDNRIALLRQVHGMFMGVADISRLQWHTVHGAVDSSSSKLVDGN